MNIKITTEKETYILSENDLYINFNLSIAKFNLTLIVNQYYSYLEYMRADKHLKLVLLDSYKKKIWFDSEINLFTNYKILNNNYELFNIKLEHIKSIDLVGENNDYTYNFNN